MKNVPSKGNLRQPSKRPSYRGKMPGKRINSMIAAPIPCWPASALETWLTRYASWRMLTVVLCTTGAIFVFGHILEILLNHFGAWDSFVIPFVRHELDFLISQGLIDSLSGAYAFKLFEISIEVAAVCGAIRLAVGCAFLRQYDLYYLYARYVGMSHGKLIFVCAIGGIGGIFCSLAAEVEVTITPMLSLIKYNIFLYALLISVLFVGGVLFCVEAILMTVWVIVRSGKADVAMLRKQLEERDAAKAVGGAR
jgi:hypothetical protein